MSVIWSCSPYRILTSKISAQMHKKWMLCINERTNKTFWTTYKFKLPCVTVGLMELFIHVPHRPTTSEGRFWGRAGADWPPFKICPSPPYDPQMRSQMAALWCNVLHAIVNIYSALEPRKIRAPNHAIMMTSSTRRFRSSASKSSPCISMEIVFSVPAPQQHMRSFARH